MKYMELFYDPTQHQKGEKVRLKDGWGSGWWAVKGTPPDWIKTIDVPVLAKTKKGCKLNTVTVDEMSKKLKAQANAEFRVVDRVTPRVVVEENYGLDPKVFDVMMFVVQGGKQVVRRTFYDAVQMFLGDNKVVYYMASAAPNKPIFGYDSDDKCIAMFSPLNLGVYGSKLKTPIDVLRAKLKEKNGTGTDDNKNKN